MYYKRMYFYPNESPVMMSSFSLFAKIITCCKPTLEAGEKVFYIGPSLCPHRQRRPRRRRKSRPGWGCARSPASPRWASGTHRPLPRPDGTCDPVSQTPASYLFWVKFACYMKENAQYVIKKYTENRKLVSMKNIQIKIRLLYKK